MSEMNKNVLSKNINDVINKLADLAKEVFISNKYYIEHINSKERKSSNVK